MKIKFTTLTVAVLLTASAALAQTTDTTTTAGHVWNDPNAWWGSHWAYTSGSRYGGNELSLDLFGSYLANQRGIENLFKTNIRHGLWGGGVGANYFPMCNFGIGGDINIPDDRGNFVNSVSGSLIARLPIADSGLAPYIFGGGGRQTQPAWEWTGHLGVGLEYRFNPITGIFTDARYSWVDKTSDTLLLRAGLRIVF